MSHRFIQQQVNDLFDRADHPNISHPDDGDFLVLLSKQKPPLPARITTEIMKDVLEAIIYVSSHLLIYKPCQVFKQHIIQKNGRFGLKNIICYRDEFENKQFNENRYWPVDYKWHENEDDELTWSLGRMWFELLTDSRIPPISALTQKEINMQVETGGISDNRIIDLLKDILVIDKTKRMDFLSLVKHGLFEYEQKSRIFLQSIIPNLSRVQQASSMIMSGVRGFESSSNLFKSPHNPFQEELYKRDFKEAIALAEVFEKVKKFISNSFEVQENKQQIDFSCYLIDLVSFIRMNNLRIKTQENSYLIVVLYDKIDYTNFLEKLLELEAKVERKRKMRRFNEFREKNPILLEPAQKMTEQDKKIVYYNFKSYLMSYLKYYKQRLTQSKFIDTKDYVNLIEMMIVRSTNYIFANCRKFVFGEFCDNGVFDLRSVLNKISNCQDLQKLKNLEKKILEMYFTSHKGQAAMRTT